MRDKAGIKLDCIYEETLDFIDVDYTHLNKTVRYEERQHGEWIEKYCELFRYYCSICGRGADIKGKFCPNCGADMRKRV